MSKYKVGDKVVMEITDRFKNAYGHERYSILDSVYSTEFIDEKSEPLRNYTEPLEAKIRRQAAEITRLLEENKRLKDENKKMLFKVDSYELYGDQHEEEYNQAFNQGAEAAWELARKLYGMDIDDKIQEAFDCEYSFARSVISSLTYTEAAAKVAEWKKAKEEIKVGDIVTHEEYDEDLCVLCMSKDKKYYSAVDRDGAVYYMFSTKAIAKTGRHIDVDSFLKQIGGNGNER